MQATGLLANESGDGTASTRNALKQSIVSQTAARLKRRAKDAASPVPAAAAEPGLEAALRQTLAAMCEGLVERETELRLLLLAVLCGEHLLLLGPPGTAKSELGRRLSRLSGGLFFERLLTRFTVPEEVRLASLATLVLPLT